MDKIIKPIGKELRDSWMEESTDFALVGETFGPEDNGYRFVRVFERLKDGTFWRVRGVNLNDGDYDTLRDEYEFITITQVIPIKETVTTYIRVEDFERNSGNA